MDRLGLHNETLEMLETQLSNLNNSNTLISSGHKASSIVLGLVLGFLVVAVVALGVVCQDQHRRLIDENKDQHRRLTLLNYDVRALHQEMDSNLVLISDDPTSIEGVETNVEPSEKTDM